MAAMMERSIKNLKTPLLNLTVWNLSWGFLCTSEGMTATSIWCLEPHYLKRLADSNCWVSPFSCSFIAAFFHCFCLIPDAKSICWFRSMPSWGKFFVSAIIYCLSAIDLKVTPQGFLLWWVNWLKNKVTHVKPVSINYENSSITNSCKNMTECYSFQIIFYPDAVDVQHLLKI